MAQLTEEIQPTFETPLKSKAVSEDTNVKFSCVVSGIPLKQVNPLWNKLSKLPVPQSLILTVTFAGHPVPEVTWYKDDVQLDRYCGLPKYEISRQDDKTHTLQIYKYDVFWETFFLFWILLWTFTCVYFYLSCTLEDAAIYQVSAQNSRGIVSCSGVLEVGTMSEYKIHQNYFAKLKLRNENRRREQEPRNASKENVPAALENVRVSSPERALRKRRSLMETRADGSPSEENDMEVDALSPTPPVQASAAASVHEISNCEMITNRDKDGQGLKYIHDTVNNASSMQTIEHYVKKKIKISTEATEGIKENRQTGRREEIMNESGASIEKMEVQNTVDQITSVTEYENKLDITDRQISEKQSVKVNKSASKESKRAQGAQIASVSESRNKMDITDTRKSEKTAAHRKKSVSEESKRAQGAQITSATESKNKMDITDTKATEKQSERVNKMVTEKLKRAQGVQITSVTESRIKMDITTNKNQKWSVKANKSPSEESKRAKGAHIASETESRNKIGITVTKTNEKQPVKVNKSASEESKRAHHASATESRNNMDITVTKTIEKQSEKLNKCVSEESKSARCAQIASVTESSNKMDIIDTKMNENKSEKVNKSVLEESKRAQGVQIASVTESSNKVDITDTKTSEKQSEKVHKSVSEESKRAQAAQITLVSESRIKVDITDTKKNDKQSEKAKESSSESKRVQKPITTQKQLPLKFSMTTQMTKVVEDTKLTKSSDKGTSNLQPQALDTIQNCDPRVIDNKLMDFDDHRNKTPVGTCVRIFPHSCGGTDVNVDTGERNASACSLRSLVSVSSCSGRDLMRV